jgi:hypothetical protein
VSARGPRRAQLTADQAATVEQARVVASAEAGESAGFGDAGPGGTAAVYAIAYGRAKATVAALLEVIDQLTGGGTS